mgnify:CR=1 FL=1|tara:strand:- start:456 stop:650 length:195 start_codon:yes stop_codon:yes gene_type:complete
MTKKKADQHSTKTENNPKKNPKDPGKTPRNKKALNTQKAPAHPMVQPFIKAQKTIEKSGQPLEI